LPECINYLEALLDAPPGRVGMTAQALLSSQPVLHPLLPEATELGVQTEIDTCRACGVCVSRRMKGSSVEFVGKAR
jgi:hypothetical protein